MLKKMRKQMETKIIFKLPSIQHPASNQDGSIIILALMVLVIMTVISLISSSTLVTENFILRNQGIYKQNINMAEAALMEGLQLFMQQPPDSNNIVDVNTSGLAWVNNMNDTWAATDWYAIDSSARILDGTNSMAIATPQNLADRGEAGAGNLRTGFVGWAIVPLPGGGSESLDAASGEPVWRQGRLISEYVSRDAGGIDNGNGMLRMEIGVKRRIVLN